MALTDHIANIFPSSCCYTKCHTILAIFETGSMVSRWKQNPMFGCLHCGGTHVYMFMVFQLVRNLGQMRFITRARQTWQTGL